MLRFEIFDFNKYQISELDVFFKHFKYFGPYYNLWIFWTKVKDFENFEKYGYYVEKDLCAKQ